MSPGDTIPQNGDYSMTNLKDATGIASDLLSEHHPNQSNAETAFGDFVCKAVGDLSKSGEEERLLPIVLYDGQGVGGSYNSNYNFELNSGDGPIRPGVPFEIFVQAYDGDGDLGDFFEQQILAGPGLTVDNTLTSDEVNIIAIKNNTPAGVSDAGVIIEAEMTSLVNPLVVAVEYSDPLNTNADNRGKENISNFTNDVGLAFRTKDVGAAVALITGLVFRMTYRNSLPNAGSSGWEVEIEPQPPYDGPEVFDPAGKAASDAFEAYDNAPDSSSPFGSSSDGEFLPGTYPLSLELEETKVGSTADFWMELDDSSGGAWDVVKCTLEKTAAGTDDWPTTDGAQEAYSFQSNQDRDPGTITQPHIMSRSDAAA